MPPKNQYRVQIPQDLLDAGFPVEWLVIDQDGTVLIHYSTPVLLENLTLDDRPVIQLTTGFKMLIGTGETVELQMRLAEPYLAALQPQCQCGLRALCNQRVGPSTGILAACSMPKDHHGDHGAEGDWRPVSNWYFDVEYMARMLLQAGVFDEGGVCRVCHQQSARAKLLSDAKRMVSNAKPIVKSDAAMAKAERLLARLERKLKQ